MKKRLVGMPWRLLISVLVLSLAMAASFTAKPVKAA